MSDAIEIPEPILELEIDGERVEVEPRPEVADEIFGDRIGVAQAYANALVRDGELLGLLGPLEYPRLWTRHIINSALIAPLLHGEVGDVGSGAGLPGIPLAIARPDVKFTLIEPMERRHTWLVEQIDELALSNATALRGRAEEIAENVAFDQVTARAVAALSKLLPWTVPLVKYGGEIVLLKGRSAEAEITKAAKVIRRFDLTDIRVEEVGVELDTEPTRVVRATVQ
ncbi:MAG: 16S rRNA (guanine(527)-N(7))-methyltransferase RsmG [Gulosibacter sp.]|uniref:16S rRNA (guanine(527)-N(7))-methyltransferase RsmG n=1 Tax=Gulosibacter sp. TaxID=2817531 RepID=UPI003F92BF1D